jgi:hypothetical protein
MSPHSTNVMVWMACPRSPHTTRCCRSWSWSRIVVGDMALNEVLTRVAQVAKDTIPGADEVSVTLVHRDHPSTTAYTGDLALGLDERQYAEGYGPCLQAARSGEPQLVPGGRSSPPKGCRTVRSVRCRWPCLCARKRWGR